MLRDDIFARTYELVVDPPPAMSWEEYERSAAREWRDLISGPDHANEAVIHAFLEQNPCFVPGPFSFPTSGHGPIYGGVFSKPSLAGVGNHVPDFMWLATATDIVYPVLIEIETPAKRWFTESGRPRAEFTQARNQLTTWKQWLNRPENRLVFMRSYGIDIEYPGFEIRPQFVLVYGRRAEFDERPAVRGTRSQQQGADEYHVSFDGLIPEYNARNYFTLQKHNNDVNAMVIPPTVRLGPAMASSWLHVKRREEAAMAQRRLSLERRRFLASRFEYWDQWYQRREWTYWTGDWE